MHYFRLNKVPDSWTDAIGDGNYSMIASGRTGSGKDGLTLYFMNEDMARGWTPIILDPKGEYAFSIFCQADVVMRNLLRKENLAGRGYKTIVWIPYTQGMERYELFQMLMKCKHPNLEIRPFRILKENFVSEDSYNMALAKTQMQATVKDGADLKGTSRQTNEIKEQGAEERLAIDRVRRDDEGQGWEYLDFEAMTRNKCVNVITTQFLATNTVAQTQFNIGMMNEFLAISKGINRVRRPDEMYSVIIPEIEMLLPRQVKTLADSSNILKFSVRTTLLFMRYYDVRLRLNLQNLTSVDSAMLGQSILYAGKTWNRQDLNMLRVFNLGPKDWEMVRALPTGSFIRATNKKQFNVIPYSHKAKEREYFHAAMRDWMADPSLFLFETHNCFLSEIVDYYQIFYDGVPLSVQEYIRRVKTWIKNQPGSHITPLHDIRNDNGKGPGLIKDAVEKELMKKFSRDLRKVIKRTFTSDMDEFVNDQLKSMEAAL